MKLYLDEDTTHPVLVRLLRQAGHDVQLPGDAGLLRRKDAVHLAHAARQGRATMTRNYRDFEELHDLVMAVGGHHPGILVIRKDNDPRRDMKPPHIVRALANLIASGQPIPDHCWPLNAFR